MRNMRLKPALTYRFKDSLRGVFIFTGVYLAIYTALFLIAGLMAVPIPTIASSGIP